MPLLPYLEEVDIQVWMDRYCLIQLLWSLPHLLFLFLATHRRNVCSTETVRLQPDIPQQYFYRKT